LIAEIFDGESGKQEIELKTTFLRSRYLNFEMGAFYATVSNWNIETNWFF